MKLILQRIGWTANLRLSPASPMADRLDLAVSYSNRRYKREFREPVVYIKSRALHMPGNPFADLKSAHDEVARAVLYYFHVNVTFEPYIHAYGINTFGDHYITHCYYDTWSESIRLIRSNVGLVAFKDDGLTTCKGAPYLVSDGANKAYAPLAESAIESVIRQNSAHNTREWLTWLISEYIADALASKRSGKVITSPIFAGEPPFPVDFNPVVTPTLCLGAEARRKPLQEI